MVMRRYRKDSWEGKLVYLALKPYPVPQFQEKKLREKVDRFCKQGILRKIIRFK